MCTMRIIKRGLGDGREITPREIAPVLSLRDAMNRMFEESFWDPFEMIERIPALGRGTGQLAFPRVDMSEDENEVKVVANVPGVDTEKIEIEVEPETLILSGKMEKEMKEEDKEKKFYRYEREYGEFRREFALPARVKPDAVTAKARDGVLEITLPKAEVEKKAKVRIDAA